MKIFDKLPKKALFLMFEDGRKDTVLFTEKLLEKLNYQATILTYGEKFKRDDQKFISAKDLRKLQKEGFWELGTNGYRLSYINCYDRYKHFLGQLDSKEFVEIGDQAVYWPELQPLSDGLYQRQGRDAGGDYQGDAKADQA